MCVRATSNENEAFTKLFATRNERLRARTRDNSDTDKEISKERERVRECEFACVCNPFWKYVV